MTGIHDGIMAFLSFLKESPPGEGNSEPKNSDVAERNTQLTVHTVAKYSHRMILPYIDSHRLHRFLVGVLPYEECLAVDFNPQLQRQRGIHSDGLPPWTTRAPKVSCPNGATGRDG